jgi:hypothetical protein
MEDCYQLRSGRLLALARNPSGIIRRATNNPASFPNAFPKKEGCFPERFPKSSRTKGWFSRTNPEQVPKKPHENVEETWEAGRTVVREKQVKGRRCPELVFHLSSICLPFVLEQMSRPVSS